jgi:hypothetical protein
LSLHLHYSLEMSDISSDDASSVSSEAIAMQLFDHLHGSSFACGGTVKIAPPLASSSRPSNTTKRTSKSRPRHRDSIDPVIIRWDSSNSTNKLVLPTRRGSITELVAGAEPASFGHKGEDVFDDSYRKASKLDTSAFSTNFCPYVSGIIDAVGQTLLPRHSSSDQGIRAELYKLNVSARSMQNEHWFLISNRFTKPLLASLSHMSIPLAQRTNSGHLWSAFHVNMKVVSSLCATKARTRHFTGRDQANTLDGSFLQRLRA